MKQWKSSLSVALILLTALAWATSSRGVETKQPEDGQKPAKASMSRFLHDPYSKAVFYAVIEGLYEDGVTTDVVEAVLAGDPKRGGYLHFVPECPICTPVELAFRVYRQRPVLWTLKTRNGGKPVDTLGDGLPEDVQRVLLTGKPEERLGAIQKLVGRWVGRRLESLRLTEEERDEYAAAFEEGRKKGMDILLRWKQVEAATGKGIAFVGLKSCAVCEGANGACSMKSPK